MRLLERIEHNTSQRQNNQVGIKDFTRLTPLVFSYSTEPLDADYWLRTMERKLQVGRVAQADWVTFASYHLEGAANSWWENFLAMQEAQHVVTWQEFTEAFRAYHIPEGLMHQKREELLKLKQGTGSVCDYQRNFNRLACYATEEVSTDAKKQDLFLKGLDPEVRRDIHLMDFGNFQGLVNKAMKAESGKVEYEETRKRPQEGYNKAGSSNKKCRVSVPYSAMSCAPYTPMSSRYAPRLNATSNNAGGSSYPPAGNASGFICFNCRQSGHYAKECPQKNAAEKAPPPNK